MEREFVIRDEINKRIRKMYKVDITEEIQNECKKCFEYFLNHESQMIAAAFQYVDTKHTYGILSEIQNVVLGLQEYNDLNEQEKKIYKKSNESNEVSLQSFLVNLTSQMIFAIGQLDDNCLDQIFIHNTILSICYLNDKYIGGSCIILPSQREFLNGLIKKLIDLYNSRLEYAILECNKKSNFWKGFIYQNNITPYGLPLNAIQNIMTISNNQIEYVNYLNANKINLKFVENMPYIGIGTFYT